ncbi:acetylglutamate kinase [Iodidimonas sp. SYSU 1G8]|uniref:acetylglutamate kinase n=1 Tax=Iodidimonas sp. SYSU 1G8 TaxID=3133967 RepID=UPI0031FEE413
MSQMPAGYSELLTATTLSEALPFMRKYAGATIVIKYGGHAMGDRTLADEFARDIVLMKQVGINPVVVHGGGPQIKQMMDRLRIESEFVDGLRVTDAATMEIVEMVLSGRINKEIVAAINRAGGSAVGLSGRDCDLLRARKVTRTKRDPDSNIERVLDMGYVGEPESVNPHVLDVLARSDLIPVIAPIGYGDEGETYNVNADTFAGAIAAAVGARRLLMLTDVKGVLNKAGELMTNLSPADVNGLIGDGTVSGGMIPKVETCLNAVLGGVDAAVILDGRVSHAVLLELFTAHGAGTLIGKS